MSGYRSIFLESDWAHVAYYGWSDSWPDPQFRIMAKRSGPLQRRLILSEVTEPARALELALAARDAAGPIAEIVVHDLTDGAAEWSSIGFDRMADKSRLLNINTFVLDLLKPEEELLANMSKHCRYDVRLAQKSGLSVIADSRPSSGTLDLFFNQFNTMAQEHGIRTPPRSALERMFADGRAMLFSIERGGEPVEFIVTYRAGDKAIYLYGTGRDRANDGAGKLLQWEVTRALKRLQVRWYDLGGVPSLDPEGGIYRFKRALGGELFSLGSEYCFRTPLARLAHLCAKGAFPLRNAFGV